MIDVANLGKWIAAARDVSHPDVLHKQRFYSEPRLSPLDVEALLDVARGVK